MKVCIFLATFNKNLALPNVLHSISMQKTNFPFYVNIIDDHSKDDPTGIVSKYLTKPYFIKRLNENVGFAKSQSLCMDYTDDATDIIILQSSDVIYPKNDLLQKLVDAVEPGVAVMPEVRNVTVPINLHEYWDKIDHYLEEKRLQETLEAINRDPKQPAMGKYTLTHTIFSGPRQPRPDIRWYFFLGAIKKRDLLKTCFMTTCGDVALSNSMHRSGLIVKYIDEIAIHQRHPIG